MCHKIFKKKFKMNIFRFYDENQLKYEKVRFCRELVKLTHCELFSIFHFKGIRLDEIKFSFALTAIVLSHSLCKSIFLINHKRTLMFYKFNFFIVNHRN